MSQKFKQFKTKMTIEVLVRSLLISISVGLLLAGGAFIATKLNYYDLNPWIIAGGAVAITVALFSAIFFPCLPSDKKVAKRLDEELGLNEKCQTMIEYRDKNTPIHEIQRESTLNILSTKPTKALKFRTPILLLCAFALTAGVFTTSQVMPKRELEISQEQKPEDPPYVLDDWTQAALMELIRYVKESDAMEEAKVRLVKNLETLLVFIQRGDATQTEVFQYVDNTVILNDNSILQVNIGDDIAAAIFASSSTGVRQIGSALNLGDPDLVAKACKDLREDLNREDWKEYGVKVHNEMGVAMQDALKKMDIDLDLPMPKQIWRMSISILNETEACKTQAEFYEALKAPCEQCAAKLPDCIVDEAININVKEYVNKRLIEIFKVTPEDHGITTSTSNATNWEDNGQDNNIGGYGKGEFVVGSDDQILDYEQGYVPYAEVIGKYLAELIEMYEDGVLPDEYKDLIDYYYGLLYGYNKGDTEEITNPGDGSGTGE